MGDILGILNSDFTEGDVKMNIYPAIDIIDGNCVRLCQGDFDKLTVFNDDVAKQAREWESCGAKYLHVVDLDGAKGRGHNREAIQKILEAVQIPIQVGGGIRSFEDIEGMVKLGVSRVILGTKALNGDFVKEAVSKYGSKIAVGIDAKEGMVAVSGWTSVSTVSALSLCQQMKALGVSTIIYTDIAKDGMMAGPNIAATKELIEKTQLSVIASGGVSTYEDLEKINKIGAEGAIIGKALYQGNISLKEVMNRWS